MHCHNRVKRFIPALSLTLMAFTLAACSLSQNMGRPSIQNIPAGIDGQWVDENGIISSFNKGVFETRAADTQEKISEGNYVFRNPQLVEIEIHSIIRGTVSQVSCIVANNAMQLLCTSSTGSQFSLNRSI